MTYNLGNVAPRAPHLASSSRNGDGSQTHRHVPIARYTKIVGTQIMTASRETCSNLPALGECFLWIRLKCGRVPSWRLPGPTHRGRFKLASVAIRAEHRSLPSS